MIRVTIHLATAPSSPCAGMPPLPLEYQGRDLAARFHAAVTFRRGRTYRLVATRANGRPAFGMYVPDPQAGICHANGLMVLTLAGSRIRAMTRFERDVLRSFGLPLALPVEAGRLAGTPGIRPGS